MKDNFPHDRVEPGENNNVIHLYPSKGGKLDIVLLESNEFDKEHGNNVEYRRKNL